MEVNKCQSQLNDCGRQTVEVEVEALRMRHKTEYIGRAQFLLSLLGFPSTAAAEKWIYELLKK